VYNYAEAFRIVTIDYYYCSLVSKIELSGGRSEYKVFFIDWRRPFIERRLLGADIPACSSKSMLVPVAEAFYPPPFASYTRFSSYRKNLP